MSTFAGLLMTLLAAAAAISAILVAVFVIAKVLWGIGLAIGSVFQGVGRLVLHVATTLRDLVTDSLRAIGGTLTGIAYVPLALGSVALGRWSASRHYGKALRGELGLAALSLYKVGISHPLRLVGLGSLLDGFERRLPEVVLYAPGADAPKEGPAAFDGWRVVGSLPSGGSGAKLFLAEPLPEKVEKLERGNVLVPTKAVIKSFSLASGSTLPQIVRESRALESAKKLGLVLEHELTPVRFHYVMPYVPGEDLSRVTTALHAQSGPQGLRDAGIRAAIGYSAGLLEILSRFHAAGLWHKDIKPSNILICGDRVELVDLGLVTPLASAMTLTTHGTEYYRDPEMVRLALRGVKVNDVDGVKFDLYSAGAVLYSLIEGSFPAHGNLSRFDKRCPDAMRWVIRRAMADVNQRYASANEMLDDLRVLLAAKDPFTVKPADLPSMGGAAARVASEIEGTEDWLEDIPEEQPKGFPPPLPLRKLDPRQRLVSEVSRVSRHAAQQARRAAKQAARDARHQARYAARKAVSDVRYAKRFASEEKRMREKMNRERSRSHGWIGSLALFVVGFGAMLAMMTMGSEAHRQSGSSHGYGTPDSSRAGSRSYAVNAPVAPARGQSSRTASLPAPRPTSVGEPARVLILGERPLILGAAGERWLGSYAENHFGWDVFGELEASDDGSDRDVELLARARAEARLAPIGDRAAELRLQALARSEPELAAVLWYGLDEDSRIVSRLVTDPSGLSRLGTEIGASRSRSLQDLKGAVTEQLQELSGQFEEFVEDLDFELDELQFEIDDMHFRDGDWEQSFWSGGEGSASCWDEADCEDPCALESCGS